MFLLTEGQVVVLGHVILYQLDHNFLKVTLDQSVTLPSSQLLGGSGGAVRG